MIFFFFFKLNLRPSRSYWHKFFFFPVSLMLCVWLQNLANGKICILRPPRLSLHLQKSFLLFYAFFFDLFPLCLPILVIKLKAFYMNWIVFNIKGSVLKKQIC